MRIRLEISLFERLQLGCTGLQLAGFLSRFEDWCSDKVTT